MTTRIVENDMTVIDNTVQPPVIVFDVDEKLFHCTNLVAGNITLSARQAKIVDGDQTKLQPINVENFYTIQPVHPLADIVLGGFRVTTFGGNQGVTGLGVFDAGGTYVHVQEGGTELSNPGTPSRDPIISMATYTFEASGGLLRLRERVALSVWANSLGVTRTTTLLQVRFEYKLYVGTLT